ncbi:MAG: hypothetical protein ABFR82_09320, partial [Nitrospirota bacterium]
MKKKIFLKNGYTFILLLIAVLSAIGCRGDLRGKPSSASSGMSHLLTHENGDIQVNESFVHKSIPESNLKIGTENIHLSSITVDVTNELKDVNYGVMGSALSGSPTSWSPAHFRYGISHITGLGVWDPVHYTSVQEVVEYARDMGVRYFRFPGGFGAYFWKHAVGPIKKRPHIYWSGQHDGRSQINFGQAVIFGLPEFLSFCSEVGAKPVIGISEYPWKVSSQAAAEMVEYLNAPCDGTCTTSINKTNYEKICINSTVYVKDENNTISSSDWAQVRVCDRYALGMSSIGEPWHVEWFEYGNESYDYYLDEPETYVKNYLQYQGAMKAVDSNIRLGAVISGSYHFWTHHRRWNMSVIPGLSNKADFYIIHKYVPRFSGCCDANDTACQDANPGYVICTSAENLFAVGLAGTHGKLHNEYKELNDLIYELTGSYVPIAVTEYGGSYNESDFDYFESFGNALITAEHVKQLMLADNISLATYHHFNLTNPGVIKGRAPPYKLRPVYYVFQFYNKHFGAKMLNAEVISKSYQYSKKDPFYHRKYQVKPAYGEHYYERIIGDTLTGKDWIIDKQPAGVKNAIDSKGVLTISFNNMEDVHYYHAWKETKIKLDTWYRLTGLIKTENLSGTKGEGIYISVTSGNIENYIRNSGFENDVDEDELIDEWVYWPADYTGMKLDSVISHLGNNSVRMDFTGNDPNISWKQTISLEPKTDYIIEGYVKANLSRVYPGDKVRGVRIDVKDTRSWQCGYWRTSGEVFNTNDSWV